MNIQTWIIIAAFLAIVIFRDLGRKEFTIKRSIQPFIICAITVFLFVKEIPTSGNNIIALTIMIAAGTALGLAMLLTVKVEYGSDGKSYTRMGFPYLLLWIIGLGWRIVLAYYVEYWNPQSFIHFMISNQLDLNVIAPAFVFFTIAMLATRTIGIRILFKVNGQRLKSNSMETPHK